MNRLPFSGESSVSTLDIQSVYKQYKPFIWIILLGISLRLLWALAVPVVPLSDSLAYDTFAKNLATGQGYGWDSSSLTAYWPVGTAFIYSLLYRILGHTYWPIVVLNLILAGAIVGVSMALAAIWFNQKIALLTGLLLALWPSQIQFTTVLASELPFSALMMVALLLWETEAITLRSRAIGVGVLMAAASYMRPTAMLLPILFLFFRVLKTKEIFKTVTATLIILLIMAVLIAPWSIRNTKLYGQFVTISTNGGANLWMGNNPNSEGGYMDLPPEVAGMNEAQRDKHLKAIAVAHIKEKPFLFLYRCVKRLIETHSRESIGIAWNQQGLIQRYGTGILLPLKILNQLYWLAMLSLGLIGIILLGKQRGWLMAIAHPVVVIWGYFAAIHAIVVAQDRYHFPSIPMIAILAAFTIVTWLGTRQKVQNVNQAP
ncbi:MAG: glycosyltransferase family 39 protein [Actinomycetota bacterium]